MFQRDQWLSDVLEMPCYRMTGPLESASSDAMAAAMAAAAPSGRAFFAAKQATDDIAAIETLVRAGFNVADVGVTLVHNGEVMDARVADGVTIENATEDDEGDIVDVAGRCFVYSRFHADRRIGAERADKIKREWVRNSCRGRAAMVYLARRAGEVAGFLAVMKRDGETGSEAVIDLIGVDAEHQGQGVGRSLSLRFIREWRGRAERLLVGTQASNIPALRLYETLGFRTTETAYALHAHLIDGKVAA